MAAPVEDRTVPIGSAEYHEVVGFLYREAHLVDRMQFEEWLACFSEDIRYRMPLRLTMMPKDGDGFVPEMGFFDDDHASLTTRVRRLQTEQAWAEQPNSRPRHFLSNILVERGEEADTYVATSSLLVTRTRDDLPYDIFTGERRDTLRREDGELRITDRLILLDQTVLQAYNLSIFF